MNQLQKVIQSFENGILPQSIYELIQKRFQLVIDGIDRIEKINCPTQRLNSIQI